MQRLGHNDLARLLDVVHETSRAVGSEEFQARILHDVADLLGTPSVSYNEVDLRGGRVETRIEGFDWTPSLLETFVATMHTHPVIAHMEATGASGPLAISDLAGSRVMTRIPVVSEVYRPMGISDQLAISLTASPGHLVGIAFNSERGPFTERTRTLLTLLQPYLVRAHRDADDRGRLRALSADLEAALDESGEALLAVDRRGRVVHATAAAGDLLARHLGPRAAETLPDDVRAWLASRRRAPTPAPGGTTMTIATPGRELALRFVGRAGGDGRDVVVLREAQPVDRRASVASAATVLRLTIRQVEVLIAVGEGLTNARIAARLGLSERTVQSHLANAYGRLGVRTRSGAAARVAAALGE